MGTPPRAWTRIEARAVGRLMLVASISLGAATVAASFLESSLGVPNASIVYLTAVVATAVLSGTTGAVLSTAASLLLYDYFFTEPRFTFTISDPQEWLSVVLLLFVGIVVGQLAAMQRSRAEASLAREREARAISRVSRALAVRSDTETVLPAIIPELERELEARRVWITVGSEGSDRATVGNGLETAAPSSSIATVLRRLPDDEPGRWVRVHSAVRRAGARSAPGTGSSADADLYRVGIEAAGRPLGSISFLRARALGAPGASATRLAAAAADQIGQAVVRDRLAAEAQTAEIARRSDALKSALLESVSHDLRTPLAAILAAAGTVRRVASSVEQHDAAAMIERDVESLDRLVANLLDLGRIQSGSLTTEAEVLEIEDLVDRAIDHAADRLDGSAFERRYRSRPVEADPVLLDEVITNLIENVIRHAPAGTPVRVTSEDAGAMVRLTVEDAGPGVPDDVLPHLFERFYRAPGGPRRGRRGMGIGLAVVEGFVHAMGGRAVARRSSLGGLAIEILLPAARSLPVDLEAVPA